MSKKAVIFTLGLFFIATWSGVSSATVFTADICVKYETNYSDIEHGDYYTDSSSKSANGIYLKIVRLPSTVIWQGYSEPEGTLTGCAENVSLNSVYSYNITAYAKAVLDDGNEIYVKSEPDGYVHSQTVAANWTPQVLLDRYEFTYQYNSTWRVSNIAAAATYSLDKLPGGVASDVFIYYTTEDCIPACFSRDYRAIFMGQSSRTQRFIVSHETGHAIVYYDANDNGPEIEYTYTSEDPCASGSEAHTFHSQEWQPAAAWEGFADFYGAAVWNNPNENDCQAETGYDCAGDERFMEINCPIPYSGRGTEGDWTHLWWDFYTWPVELLVRDIVDIYTYSSYEYWEPDNVVTYLGYSVVDLNFLSTSEWNNWCNYEGVNH